MRRTIIDPRFRAVLTNLIVAAGTSQARLAKQAAISPSHLSELINGTKNPSDQTARALDDALDAGGQLTDLVVHAANPEDLDRLAAAAHNPRRIGFATLDSLARILAGQRHLDDLMGSAAVIGPAVAQLDLISRMTTEAAGPDRAPLLSEAGQWAQFTAWLHISTGRFADARAWLGRGMQWAMELGDPDLTATLLSYQAHVAWLTLQHGPAIGLATAALRDERVYPGQRAYDAYQAARGHAAVGDLGEADRLLGQADELAAATNGWAGPVPPWQYYRAPWLWSLERGLVNLYASRHDAGRAAAAVADLGAGVAGVPEEMAGADWAGEYLVHLASAYRRAGGRGECRETLGRARMIAEATHSGRVLQLVTSGERSLRLDERGY